MRERFSYWHAVCDKPSRVPGSFVDSFRGDRRQDPWTVRTRNNHHHNPRPGRNKASPSSEGACMGEVCFLSVKAQGSIMEWQYSAPYIHILILCGMHKGSGRSVDDGRRIGWAWHSRSGSVCLRAHAKCGTSVPI